jgi:hypothetical protein
MHLPPYLPTYLIDVFNNYLWIMLYGIWDASLLHKSNSYVCHPFKLVNNISGCITIFHGSMIHVEPKPKLLTIFLCPCFGNLTSMPNAGGLLHI